MIRAGTRHGRRSPPAWSGVVAAVLLGALLAARPADPAAADPAMESARLRLLVEQAGAADEALGALDAEMQPARQAARRGAALVLDGDDPPAPVLEHAAQLLEGAGAEAEAAVGAMDLLRGLAASMRAGVHIPIVPEPGQLSSIAGQLRDAADAAAPFVERRQTARRTLERLEDALAALEADDPAAALPALADARRARSEVAGWDPEPVTLPLWLETTGRLISAAEAIAEAALAGDEQAAEAAARRYAEAAEDAHRADVSLALSLSEAGSALTATPLRRLADALAEIEVARSTVASLLQDSG